MRNQNAIEIKNLSFCFGDNVILKNINLAVEKGKFYTVLGPNGSGKTTLLRNIAKTLEVKEGVIYINGRDLKRIGTKRLAQELAVVPQSTTIEFEFSVLDVALMGRAPYLSRFATEGEADLEIVRETMVMTDTWHLRDRSINTLSGGERQRVLVARAIAQQTGIILLDEPVSHLDIDHQIGLLKQLKALNVSKQVTALVVLHDLNLAAAFSDYLILMDKGSIHSRGTPEEVLQAEIIKEVYGVEAHVMRVPETDKPYVVPRF